MLENNKTVGVVVGVVAAALIGLGVFWFVSSDSEDTTSNTSQTTQDSATQTEEQASEMTQKTTIVSLAVQTQALSTLVTAVQAADLVETLESDGPFTVFAPTNDAFGALPAGTLETLLKPENVQQLKSILTYHVVAGKVMAADLSDGQVVKTVQGENLTIKIQDGKVYIVDAKGGEAMVETADVMADNGVVHVISSVLLPS